MAKNSKKNIKNVFILPLKNSLLFPKIKLPVYLTREYSVKLVEKALEEGLEVGVIPQKYPDKDNIEFDDLYQYGVIGKLNVIKSSSEDDPNRVVVETGQRFKVNKFLDKEPFISAQIELLEDVSYADEDPEIYYLRKNIEYAVDELDLPPEIEIEYKTIAGNLNNEEFFNFVATIIDFPLEEKINLLIESDVKKRASLLFSKLMLQIQKSSVRDEITRKVHENLSKSQKEFILQEHMREIQRELGKDPLQKDIDELKEKASKKKWPKKVAEIFDKELKRLSLINQMSPEYGVQMSYLNVLVELPWNEVTQDTIDLNRAKEILDRDHYGLEQVKERILEYLAVLKLKGDMKSPILCLVGPPGVGKTSLGRSIAEALNRKFVRMSLGGLHDEAEIRGHRRTYIGAMPGRIIQSIRRVQSSNPVFILDEIDKIGSDFKGDPASALLEVLDPEQNTTFFDNYLEVEYDLSKVLFIATANTTATIHPALLDRMEVIEMTGYLLEEKVQIAQKHLLPKQLEAHGVLAKDCIIGEEEMKFIIENYTRESGVRELDKKIASIVRKRAKEIAQEASFAPVITFEKIKEYLGVPKYHSSKYEDFDIAGIATGMAWTPVGGEILIIEASATRGNGKLTLTGNLGKVMIESATLAYEFIKSNYDFLKINPKIFKYWDVHVHAPEGAIPKDGPSAGITITCALASLFTQRKVLPYIAMTGEITLTGRILPVGGIKEKILAAKRAGIKKIILPKENKPDVEEIKPEYLSNLEICYVNNIKEVLDIVLEKEPTGTKVFKLPKKNKKNN